MKPMHLFTCLFVVSAVILLAGCYGPDDPEPDVTAPAVDSVEPAAGRLHIPINTIIVVHFSEEVDPASVTSDAVVITDPIGTVVTGSLSPGQVTTFTPDSPFMYASTYTLTVTTGIADSSGNALESDFSGSFSTRAVPVAGGGWHGLAATDDGSVWAWGVNWTAQLGDGTYGDSVTPVQVVGPGGTGFFTNAVAVAAGSDHSVALKEDGTVWAWGYNGNGLLGDGTDVDRETPVQVVGPGGSGWLTDIVAISAGYYQSFALQSDGTVWGWGANREDQVADLGGAINQDTPVQAFADAVAISSGIFHTLALKDDGTVWAWGWDPYGELGDGTAGGSNVVPTPVVGPGGTGFLTDIVAIGAGEYVSAAVKRDGTVWTWGGDYNEQLGDGPGETDQPAPVQVLGPGGSGYLTGIVQVQAAYDHVVALKNDGTVWSWGYNGYGEIGNGTKSPTVDEEYPVQAVGTGGIGLLTGVSGLATTEYYSSYAALSDGMISGWGWNEFGEIGPATGETADDATPISSTPVQTSALDLIP
jgi:alpha-tubulin suppressor-like RCC1 family protein